MSSRISRLFGRVGGFATCAVLSAALDASPASSQTFSLEDLKRPAAEYQGLMLNSCAGPSFHASTPREAIIDQYFAYQTRTLSAPRGAEPLHMAFLLKPPYACTPRVDALYSLPLDELADLSDDEFAAFGIRLAQNRAERVGSYEQRMEFDRRAARARQRFASLRDLLRERRFDDAHDLLGELNPGGPEINLLGLAQLLLKSTDREAQQYGRRCLNRIEGVDPVVAIDVHLLAGAVALKERRWSEARLHFEHVALRLSDSHALLSEQDINRRLRETYLSLAYVDERRGNYMQGLNDIDMAIALDPNDPTALLHKVALELMRSAPQYPSDSSRLEGPRRLCDDASSRLAGAAELQFVDLLLQVFGYSPELLEHWEKTAAQLSTKGLPPEVEAQVKLKSAELLAAGSKFAEAAEKLAAAERLDRAQVTATPRWPELLFVLSDARAATVLGRRFLVDPNDHESGRMLCLALLDSADPRERSRGAAIAEMLHRADPESVPLKVAAASAHFMHGRNEEALKLVEPLVGFRTPTKWERRVGYVSIEAVTSYTIDAQAFSPFDPEHLSTAWLITQADDALHQERQELKQSPLAIESEVGPPPQPATLSADDAYLVARILFRMDDAKSPERTKLARNMLDWVVKTSEPTRYRIAAAHLQGSSRNLSNESLLRLLSAPPPSLLRPKASPVEGIDIPGITR